ncbi:Ig-like domain-containing protein [Paenibacillus sp. GP183]|uniref:Ig-like domain-containing protein n=1 Tax=Paenibacillus sp. GP183 TaxID=1882751 RepID=UPI0008950845|nr:Ig-like domain-containing protein [Paenibacillus sp. GP183]SEC80120.1 Carbohydrate binding module (family 35) [Paenibacillus sp. GP183]
MKRIKHIIAIWMSVLLLSPLSVNAQVASSNITPIQTSTVTSVVYDGVTGAAFDTVTESTYIRIKNKWQSNYLYEGSDGTVRYGFTGITDQTSDWILETSGSYQRIKNRATGHYITSAKVVAAQVDSRKVALTSEAISVSTAQDQWIIEDASRAGYKTIRSAATPTANNYIHEEDQLGYAQMSLGIGPTFESPQWKFEPASDMTPVRILSKAGTGHYLFEDNDGLVKSWNVPVNDARSHWYLISDDGTSTVRLKNRVSGHYITQNAAAVEALQSLPLNNAAQTTQKWKMTTNAADPGWLNFSNVDHLSPAYFLIAPADFADHTTRSIGMDWGRDGNGDDQKWKFELAADVNPTRIVNFTDAATVTSYLFEDNVGIVKIGALGTTNAYLWLVEEKDGKKRLKNLLTGHYISSQNGSQMTDPLQSLNIPISLSTDQWKIDNSTIYDDYKTIKSAANPSNYINVAQATHAVVSSAVAPDTNPAQWLFEDPSVVAGVDQYVRIQSSWDANSLYLYEDSEGNLKYGNASTTDQKAQWLVAKYEGRKTIRNRASGHYINMEDMSTGHIRVTALDFTNMTIDQKNKAKWVVEDLGGGVKLVHSVNDTNSNPDHQKFIHVQNLIKYAEYGEINRNWTSAHWNFLPVVDAVKTNFRIKNKITGAYLYEDTATGIVKNGALSATDALSQWFFESSSGNTVRLKNMSTGHYMNLHTANPNTDPVFSETIGVANTNQWRISDADAGSKYIVSAWTNAHLYATDATGNLYIDYAHFDNPATQEQTKWIFEDAPDTTANYRIKNKITGAYLYEDTTTGIVKNGSPAAESTLSQWFFEDSTDNTVRLKNMSTGHYMNLHTANPNTDPVFSETIGVANTNQWRISDADAGSKYFVSAWTNAHLYATDATGNLYIDYAHFDNLATRDQTKWVLEKAPSPPPVPAGYIRIANNGKYLYESNSGVVLYGDAAADNGYSNWIAEYDSNTGAARIKNRETGHYMAMNTDYRYIESIPSASVNDLKTQWIIEANGPSFLIRSNNGSYNDEYINVKNAEGYAERGLYSNTLPSLQWTAEAAPSVTHTPAVSVDLNRNTATKVFDDSNYVTIRNKSTGKYLYEDDGIVKYRDLKSQNDLNSQKDELNSQKDELNSQNDDLTSQWLVSDFNGHKLIKNRATGHLMAIEGDQPNLTASSIDKSVLGTQWMINDFLGYKNISSALPSHDYMFQNSTKPYAQHGTVNSNQLDTELWMFTEVPRDISYEAENAFISGSVQKTSNGYVNHFTNTGDKVIFAVNAQADDRYDAKIRYANPTGTPQTLSLYVNGLKLKQLIFAPTKNGNANAVVPVKLPLRSGFNSVSLELDSMDSGQVGIDSLTILDDVNLAYRGANQSYITYEAEDSDTNGTIIGPTRAYHEFASEASGRRAVKLTETTQHVNFTLAKPANSLVLRYSIPDGSTNASIGLYVNDAFVKNINLTSKFAWEYGNYPWSKDPAQGSPHRFFDETHVLIGQNIPAGAAISLRKTNANPSYVIIDFADMEQAPTSAYTMPAGFISITEHGATANDGSDDTAAIRATIIDAKAQHKGVWIPAGTFIVKDEGAANPLIFLDDVTIRGAGMWYTTLIGAKFYGNGSNIRVFDLAIDGDLNIRDDNAHTNGFEGAFGPGSTIQNVWIEHTKTGMWITRPQSEPGFNGDAYTDGFYVAGLRIRDTMADGINFSINTKNSMVEQTNVRYPGDDGLAMWSTLRSGHPDDYTDNNTFRFDTVQLPWLADNMVVFGGKDNKMTDNVLTDTIYAGGGIAVSTRFDPTPLAGTTVVERNTMIRTGSRDNGLGLNFGAIWVYADSLPINSDIQIKDNIALNSTYQGLSIQGSKSINHVSVESLVIDGAGLTGIEAASTISGSITMNHFTIRNIKLGGISNKAGSNLAIIDQDTLVTNISLTAAGNRTMLRNGSTLQFKATVLPGNASNNAVTWSVVPGTGVAIISEKGLLTAIKDGTVTVKATAQDGSGIIGEKTITILAKSDTATGSDADSSSNDEFNQ